MSLTKTDLKAIEKIIDRAIDTKVKPMIDDLAESTAMGFNEVDRRFDEVDKKFAEVDERFDEVDKKFAEVDKRFDEVDKKFAEVDERFDVVDKQITEVNQRLGSLELETSRISGNTAGLRDRLDIHERRITRLESKPS